MTLTVTTTVRRQMTLCAFTVLIWPWCVLISVGAISFLLTDPITLPCGLFLLT